MKTPTLPAPSYEFLRAFADQDSLTVTCSCGRSHFASRDEGCYEPGELDGWRNEAEERPEVFVEHPDVTLIDWGYLGGRVFVWGCPCHGAAAFETLFRDHRDVIAAYFQARAERQLREAQDDARTAERVKVAAGSA